MRSSIVTAMKARFETIIDVTELDPWYTTLGNNVGVWRTVPLKDTELPYLNIRDTVEEVVDDTQGGASGRMTQRRLTVELEIVSPDIATLRNCQHDVELAISSDETWDGLALRTQPISSEVLATQERDGVGGMVITVRVDYRTGRWSVS